MNHLLTPMLKGMSGISGVSGASDISDIHNGLAENFSKDLSSEGASENTNQILVPNSSRIHSSMEYHELGVRHPYEANVLEELKQNLDQLQDLHFRLKYLMGEIGQHTRKRS